jgi:hypothetical protein
LQYDGVNYDRIDRVITVWAIEIVDAGAVKNVRWSASVTGRLGWVQPRLTPPLDWVQGERSGSACENMVRTRTRKQALPE